MDFASQARGFGFVLVSLTLLRAICAFTPHYKLALFVLTDARLVVHFDEPCWVANSAHLTNITPGGDFVVFG